MKNKKLHLLSVLLILVMTILTVATSRTVPAYYNRMDIISHDNYLYININPVNNINDYIDSKITYISITMKFEDNENSQLFVNNFTKKEYYITNVNNIGKSTERNNVYSDKEIFEIFFENNTMIIKLNKNLINYDRFYVNFVSLSTNNSNEIYR